MEIDQWFINLFWVVCGWYFARSNGRDAIDREKMQQRTIAIQSLYLNGMGEISDDEFDTHDRVEESKRNQQLGEISSEDLNVHRKVKQKIDELVNLDWRSLAERIGTLSINNGHWDENKN